MQSTKVMLRDKVAASLGGNLLSLDGPHAHILSLNLGSRSPPLSDDEVVAMCKSLMAELRRRHNEVRILRACTNVTLQVSVRLDVNDIGDAGAAALASTLKRVSDIAKLRLVNLFGNRISDTGAIAVGELIKEAVHAIDEIRLGRNPIGRDVCHSLSRLGKERQTTLQLPKIPASREVVSDARGLRFTSDERQPVFRQLGANDQVLILRFSGLEPPLKDDDVLHLATKIVREIRQRRKALRLPTTGSLVELKILLQQNCIGDDGISALVAAFQSLRDVAWISDLRVYANRIGDTGAGLLSEFLRGMIKPPEEIHASDNSIGIEGAKALLDAVAEVYPVGKSPLWLQLNNNDFDSKELLRYAKDSLNIGVCLATQSSCTKSACKQQTARKTAVHLLCSKLKPRETKAVYPPRGAQPATFTNLVQGRFPPDSSHLRIGKINGNERRLLLDRSNENPQLNDDDAVQIAVDLTMDARALLGDAANTPMDLELCLEGNKIGDRGVLAVAGAVLHLGDLVRVTKLSFARNCVGDEGVAALADLVSKAKHPILELYLNHNCIKSCGRLVGAAKGRYPVLLGSTKRPFYLDLRNNRIPKSTLERVLQSAEELAIPLGFATRGEDLQKDCIVHSPQLFAQQPDSPVEPSNKMERNLSDSKTSKSLNLRENATPKQKQGHLTATAEEGKQSTQTERNQQSRNVDPSISARNMKNRGRVETVTIEKCVDKDINNEACANRLSYVGNNDLGSGSLNGAEDSQGTSQADLNPASHTTKDVRKSMLSKPMKQSESPKESSLLGRILADSIIERGYSEKHSKWIAAAFLRCERTVTQKADTWTIFARQESFDYPIRRSFSPQQQRDLQDELLRRGFIAIVAVNRSNRKLKATVSVIACAEECRDCSFTDVKGILHSCDAMGKLAEPRVKNLLKRETRVTRQGEGADARIVDDLDEAKTQPVRNKLASKDDHSRPEPKKRLSNRGKKRKAKAVAEKSPQHRVDEFPKMEPSAVNVTGTVTENDSSNSDAAESPEVGHSGSSACPSASSRPSVDLLSSDRKGWGDDESSSDMDEEEEDQHRHETVDTPRSETESQGADHAEVQHYVHNDLGTQLSKCRNLALAAAEAAAAAQHAQDELDATSVAEMGSATASFGLQLRKTLSNLEDDIWEYIMDTIANCGDNIAIRAVDRVASVLDAFVPEYRELPEESRDVCVSLLLRGAKSLIGEANMRSENAKSLQDVFEYVNLLTLAKKGDSRTIVEVEHQSDGICEQFSNALDRWALIVTRLLETSWRKLNQSAVLFATLVLHWKVRYEANKALAISILELATPVPFDTSELKQAWKECKKDVVAACNWLTGSSAEVDNTSSMRDHLRQRAKDENLAKSKEHARQRRDDSERKQREERRQRQLLLERYAQRPSTAGWKSTINAKTITYGSETSKVRYLDGKVVTTTGQKEIVLRDGPAEGEGYNRIKKTGGGSLRCAAAGSRTIS